MDSFIFYKSFYDAAKDLPLKQRGIFYDYIVNYAINGEEPTKKSIENTLFKLVKPQLDANKKRRENGAKGGKYGSLGGRPKIDKNPIGVTDKNPIGVTDKTPNVNVNVNVNDNVNDNVFLIGEKKHIILDYFGKIDKSVAESETERFVAYNIAKGNSRVTEKQLLALLELWKIKPTNNEEPKKYTYYEYLAKHNGDMTGACWVDAIGVDKGGRLMRIEDAKKHDVKILKICGQ